MSLKARLAVVDQPAATRGVAVVTNGVAAALRGAGRKIVLRLTTCA